MKFLPAQSLSSRRDSLENPSSKACGNNYTKGVENQYLASLGVKRMSERHLGDIWEPSGRKLGPGKPRHALARKCAKFIVKTDENEKYGLKML